MQTKELQNATLVFLIKMKDDKIAEICLALKKRGFGANRWNGVGGKVNVERETIEEGAMRESEEEVGVRVSELKKVAELTFYFSENNDWDQVVHVYTTQTWDGEPRESEEMRPKWFPVSKIPFDEMWPDDIFWLPEVLRGNFVKASFTFGVNDVIQKQEVCASSNTDRPHT